MSTLILTRPEPSNQRIVDRLTGLGFTQFVSVPALRLIANHEIPPAPTDYDLIICVSGYAAQTYLDRCEQYGAPTHLVKPGTTFASVGCATAKVIAQHRSIPQLTNIIYPTEGIDSEALLPLLPIVNGIRVLIVRADSGRDWLRQQLQALGAHVDIWSAYTREHNHWSDDMITTLASLMKTPNNTTWWLTSTAGALACLSNLNATFLVEQWLKQRFWFAHRNVMTGLTQHISQNMSTMLTNPYNLNYDICLPTEDALLTKLELYHD